MLARLPCSRGDALQLAGVVRVGGYRGERYRSFLFAPWTEWQERVWDVPRRDEPMEFVAFELKGRERLSSQ